MTDAYRADKPTHGGYGMPKGPIPTVSEDVNLAIGFCPRCGENSRKTCSNRGMFDCNNCTYWWYDSRVGAQQTEFDDYFSKT